MSASRVGIRALSFRWHAQAAPEFGPERLRSSKGGILFVIRKQMSRGLYVL